jgi:hypothetical protein
MVSVTGNYSKFEVYKVVTFLQVWCNKCKDCRTALNDDAKKYRGKPRTSHTDENCVNVDGLMSEDRRFRESLESRCFTYTLGKNIAVKVCLDLQNVGKNVLMLKVTTRRKINVGM